MRHLASNIRVICLVNSILIIFEFVINVLTLKSGQRLDNRHMRRTVLLPIISTNLNLCSERVRNALADSCEFLTNLRPRLGV
jgi:hypothetical protein